MSTNERETKPVSYQQQFKEMAEECARLTEELEALRIENRDLRFQLVLPQRVAPPGAYDVILQKIESLPGISRYSLKAMRIADVKYWAELLQYSATEAQKKFHISHTTMAKIREVMDPYGLTFGCTRRTPRCEDDHVTAEHLIAT